MASTYWIKAYYEILDDPKMGRLPDHIWRRAIELFLLAGEAGNGGYLPPVSDIAWRLRATDDDVTECLTALRAANIVDVTDDGWIVTHFAERQDANSNAERQARYRQRNAIRNESVTKRNADSNEPRNEPVTKRYTDIDIDIDTDRDADADKTPPVRPEIYSIYEQEIGALTPMIADKLTDAESEYPDGWVADALKESALNNARNWKYAEAILRRWKSEGRGSKRKNAKQTDAEFEAAMQAAAAEYERNNPNG